MRRRHAFSTLQMLGFSLTLALLVFCIAQTRPGNADGGRSSGATDPRLAQAARGLARFDVEVRPAGAFGRGKQARFEIQCASASVLGRVSLRPQDPDQEVVTFFLHGQERELVRIPPGRYEGRLAFWRPGQQFPIPYPHALEFRLKPGDHGILEIDRDSLGAIKKYLEIAQPES